MDAPVNRRVVLARLPGAELREDDFALEQAPPSRPSQREVLLRAIWLSLDPYQRNWMAGADRYGAAAVPGATVIGRTVSEVLESRDGRFAPGDIVLGETGWQTHPTVAGDALRRVDPAHGPLSTALGVLGSPGLTAWVGIVDITAPQAGETVVVSAATGAVGSVAGQLARLRGARVVGIAGTEEKCRLAIEGFGYHACVARRDGAFEDRLREACGDGVDVYFDNTGGPVSVAVYRRLRRDARVALCGLVAEYGQPEARGPDMRHVLANQATVRGFSVRRHLHRMDDYRREAVVRIRDGTLRYHEHVTAGLEHAPKAFSDLLAGRTVGKCLVRVSHDPPAH